MILKNVLRPPTDVFLSRACLCRGEDSREMYYLAENAYAKNASLTASYSKQMHSLTATCFWRIIHARAHECFTKPSQLKCRYIQESVLSNSPHSAELHASTVI